MALPYEEYYKLLEPKYKYNQAFVGEEEIAIAETVRKFVNQEVMPARHDLEGGWHRDHDLAWKTMWSLYKKVVELGIVRSNYPEKFGGLEAPPISRILCAEELSRGDLAFGTMAGKVHWAVGLLNMAQREDLLEEFAYMVTGEDAYTPCICVTEPSGGGNTEDVALGFRTVRTIARRDGDHYIIKGHKVWPGDSGPVEHFQTEPLTGHMGYFVVATEDPAKAEAGIGIYYIPPDAEGLEFSEPFQKMGQLFTDENREVWFDDVRIPAKYRIDKGEPGLATKMIHMGMVGLGKMTTAARLCGAAQGAFECVLDYTKHREIVGQPMRERSLFAGNLAEMWAQIEGARAFYMSTVWMAMHPEIYGPGWSKEMMSKYAACRVIAAQMCDFVCGRGIEMMGSYGYSYEFNIEKYYRDFKEAQLWLGGYGRDRMDICQGLYGPFKWGGQEEWEKEQTLASASIKKRVTAGG